MKKKIALFSLVVLSGLLGYAQTPQQRQAATPQARTAAPATASAQRALVDQYCVTCHSEALKRGGLVLANLDMSHVSDNPELWERVIRKLRAGVMPPPGARRPDPATYEALSSWLENEIDRSASGNVNPGTIGVHRMNRTEYQNAIRDLLALEIDASTYLPADDSSNGFDNIAGTLSISPTLLESYVSAAAKISRVATGHWETPTEATYIAPSDTSQNYYIPGLPFGTRGGMLVRHTFPADGEYNIVIDGANTGTFIGGEQLEVSINGERIKLFEYDKEQITSNRNGRPEQHAEVRVPVKAGTHNVGVTFLATNFHPQLDMFQAYMRSSLDNYSVDGYSGFPSIGIVKIQGPFNVTGASETPTSRKIFSCRPANAGQEQSCAKQIISELSRQAYRRPVNETDLESLMGFYDTGRKKGTFEDGIEMALRRILASPQFLVRMENEPTNVAVGKTFRISDLELASRLSFFLWSTLPDEQLINLANQGRLKDARVLEQQVKRMLADPRSDALVKNFAGQWLYLRNLPSTAPVQTSFPDWDDNLRQGFRTETEMLFETIVREDRNVVDLLTADYTFVNERLAKHYGIPNVYGSLFRRVSVGPERRGLLGQGSILTVNSQPNRTSPVKRGVWILENILGTKPPDPPPNVPPLENTTGEPGKVLTLREKMSMHRANEPCATCHRIMDPMGFALENFDADGKWRLKDGGDGGVVIDPSGEIFDGTKVGGPADLRQALLRYSPQFVRNVTEKLMTYGLGRAVEYYDMPVLRTVVRDAARDNNKFSSIILGIVKSAPFQMKTKTEESALR
jgi:mono/diheme cytochrome c family protein